MAHLKDALLSFYRGADKDVSKNATYPLAVVVNTIAQEKYAQKIAQLRSATTKDEARAIKAGLCAVTFSGTFKERNDNCLSEYSGLICIDFDGIGLDPNDLSAVNAAKSKAADDPTVVCAFISPSGTGLKVVYRVATDATRHRATFAFLAEHAARTIGHEVDASGVNVSRLCFVSSDVDVWVNYEAVPYRHAEADMIEAVARLIRKPRPIEWISQELCITVNRVRQLRQEAVTLGLVPPEQAARATASRMVADTKPSALALAETWATSDVGPFAEGNRHNWCLRFANICNRLGVQRSESERHLSAITGWGTLDADIQRIYSDTYVGGARYHATCRLKGASQPETRRTSAAPQPIKQPQQLDASEAGTSDGTNTDNVSSVAAGSFGSAPANAFWWRTAATAANPNGILKIDHAALMQFLNAHGFWRVRTGDALAHLLVRIEANRVSETDPANVKAFVRTWLDAQPQRLDEHADRDELMELFVKGDKVYISESKLEWLPICDVPFAKDTRNEGFLFYANTVVSVTAQGIRAVPWDGFGKLVWSSWILDRTFDPNADGEASEFGTFLRCMQGESDAPNATRAHALRTAVGYMIHGYKDPALPKAVVLVDERIPTSDDDTNGGTGKSLVAQAIGKIRPSLTLSKAEQNKISKGGDFPLQRMKPGIRVVNLNDLPKDFAFPNIFDLLTEGMVVEHKGEPSYCIEYADSPKFFISTNYSIDETGTSVARRKAEYEASAFYGPNYTPLDQFGHRFFDEWDELEWQAFDKWMAESMSLFLREGLIASGGANVLRRKLTHACGREWADFVTGEWAGDADAAEYGDDVAQYAGGLPIVPHGAPRKEWDRADIMRAFVYLFPEYSSLSMQGLTRWLQAYASIMGATLDIRRSNGKTLVMLTGPPKRG